MAVNYKNIVITPNTGSSTGDPTIVFSGANTSVNTDITLRVYPDSNGTLSFEGAAGQLFSITNDLTNTVFSVNDVSGIPLIEVNVASQQITLGQFYGNVGIGTANAIYKFDCNGAANIVSPTLLVAGQNVLSTMASKVASVTATAGVSNVTVGGTATAPTIGLTTVTTGASPTGGISALTFDNYGRVTSVTGSAGYITSAVTSIASGNTSIMTMSASTGAVTVSPVTSGVTAGAYSGGISAISVDSFGRIQSITGSAGYITTGLANTDNVKTTGSLQVNNNVFLANNAYVSNTIWQVVPASAGSAEYLKWGDGAITYAQIGGYYDAAGYGHLELYCNNNGTLTETVRVSNTGKVGIGNTAPQLQLEVNGNMSVDAFVEFDQTISTSYTITTGRNALTAGPITIASGSTITVPSGSTWTIV